jgi:tripartite-type tricarboxylate transporter receptor subunit TctC
VPAVAETLPGFENLGWFGLMAPAGTPKAVIDKVHRDAVTVLGSPEVRKRFEELGMSPVGNTPAEFTKAMKEETARWANVVQARKLQID